MTPEHRIFKIVAYHCNTQIEKVIPESKLEDLGFDSLDMIELLLELEDEFNIDIEPDNFECVKDIIYYIGDALEESQ